MDKYPKRLIEVDLPIKRISEHARKLQRQGRIAALHAWWARKPLSACRSVICASLWPDPADELCPDEFRKTARELMIKWAKDHLKLTSEESYKRFIAISKDVQKLDNNLDLRKALLDFIADFSMPDNGSKKEYLITAQRLTLAAHEFLGGVPETAPLLVDPFAGGGSIPLESLRVGAKSFANDLNPVAVLMNKILIEYIPKFGESLANEVKKWGEWIKGKADKELGEFYEKESDGSQPISYIWARTVICEGPTCGAVVPMKSTMWLAQKVNRRIALRFNIDKVTKTLCISVETDPKNVQNGTVKRGSVTCPFCGYTTQINNVRKQLRRRQGGASDAMMMAVVIKDRSGKRKYRAPIQRDINSIRKVHNFIEKTLHSETGMLSYIPNEPTPSRKSHRSVVTPRIYGIETWKDFFTPRQLVALITLCNLIRQCAEEFENICEEELLIATQTVMALVLDKVAQYNSTACRWKAKGESFVDMFGHHAFPFGWDFAESVPISEAVGSFGNMYKSVIRTIKDISRLKLSPGDIYLSSAATLPLPDASAQIIVTDPPYYDAVSYGDLSDFFYVWLKRVLHGLHNDILGDNLVNKENEIIVKNPNDQQEHKNFLEKMQMAMEECKRILDPSGLGVVIFAHKSTAGWEAQLEAMVAAGWTITASWPLHTELTSRLGARATASLSSSIHLVCRPRKNISNNLGQDCIGDWRDVLAELPKRIHEWMPRLAEEGVVGADAIFACLGPALEIYSRYSSVEKASGEKVGLKEYLEQVWAAVSREALKMIFEGADASGFEEDARLTAMWLWTLRTTANGNNKAGNDAPAKSLPGYSLEYDAARRIAQGMGAHLENLSHLVEIKGNTATLLSAGARTRYLFGKDAGEAPKGRKRKKIKQQKFNFMGELKEMEEESGDWAGDLSGKAGSTVLDKLHQSMILFGAGRGEALKRFLVDDGIGMNPLYWRLAQSLSALYPSGTDEKRWVDGVLARKKGLGF